MSGTGCHLCLGSLKLSIYCSVDFAEVRGEDWPEPERKQTSPVAVVVGRPWCAIPPRFTKAVRSCSILMDESSASASNKSSASVCWLVNGGLSAKLWSGSFRPTADTMWQLLFCFVECFIADIKAHPPAAVFGLDWWLVSMRPSCAVPCALKTTYCQSRPSTLPVLFAGGIMH